MGGEQPIFVLVRCLFTLWALCHDLYLVAVLAGVPSAPVWVMGWLWEGQGTLHLVVYGLGWRTWIMIMWLPVWCWWKHNLLLVIWWFLNMNHAILIRICSTLAGTLIESWISATHYKSFFFFFFFFFFFWGGGHCYVMIQQHSKEVASTIVKSLM